MRQQIERLRQLEALLFKGGDHAALCAAINCSRATLQRDMRLLTALGNEVTSSDPNGGNPEQLTTYRCAKRSSVFRH